VQINEVDPESYDALAIPGGFHSHGFDEVYDERLREICRRVHQRGGGIATWCVGVLPVAEAGLLSGKRAVSYPYSRNHDNLGRLRELGAIVPAQSWVEDDRILSCRGPGDSLKVTLRLLENLIGPEHAAEVQRLMVFCNTQ